MRIRQADASDAPAIAEIILPVIREGATYALDPGMSESDALAYWTAPDKETFIAEENGVTLGTIGRIPEAFPHPEHGYVDALVMYRKL